MHGQSDIYGFKLFRVIIIATLLLGIVFRFTHLDKKNYWYDEVHTSLRIAGYTYTQVEDVLATDQPIGIDDLQHYQRYSPAQGFGDFIQTLNTTESHITPLYFVLARLWTNIWGLTPLQTRLVAALISLLALPSMYWLGYELFQSSSLAGLATALIAVSPVQVLYAQEARNYSLLAASVLLSSACLLRSLRLRTPLAWASYAVVAAIALYSNLLAALVLCGHGVYIGLLYGWRQIKLVRGYGLAMLGSFVSLLPWLVSSDELAEPNFVTVPFAFSTLFKRFLFNITVNFFDLQIVTPSPVFDTRYGQDGLDLSFTDPALYLSIICLLLLGYTFYFLIQHSSRKVYLFILISIGMSSLPLLIGDIWTGGQRSTITRYLIPSLLGVQLAVAYTLGSHIGRQTLKRWQRQAWQLGTFFLLLGCILSCSLSMGAATWWHKYSSYHDPQIAAIINQSSNPTVMTSVAARAIALSYLVEPDAMFIVASEDFSGRFDDTDSIFLYWPKRRLIEQIEEQALRSSRQIELIPKLGQLWELKLQSSDGA